jgi:hypothetical protein
VRSFDKEKIAEVARFLFRIVFGACKRLPANIDPVAEILPRVILSGSSFGAFEIFCKFSVVSARRLKCAVKPHVSNQRQQSEPERRKS